MGQLLITITIPVHSFLTLKILDEGSLVVFSVLLVVHCDILHS